MNYNLMLIVVMVLVCTTYVLINDRTIKKFNSTYTTYNELNQFYDNLKNLNDALQVYLYSPDDQNYKDFHRYRTVLQGNVEKVKASLKNQDHVWRFELLNNMVDGYMAQAELVIASDLQQEKEFSAKYQELLYEYDLINKTASEYYGLATQDMQLQKAAVNSNQKTMQLVSLFFILYLIVWMIYFSISTIKSITDPLEKVINNMNRIKKGAYDLTQISNTNKEMNVLCLALEDMADSIEKNIQYENEKARLERRVLEQQNDNLRKDELLEAFLLFLGHRCRSRHLHLVDVVELAVILLICKCDATGHGQTVVLPQEFQEVRKDLVGRICTGGGHKQLLLFFRRYERIRHRGIEFRVSGETRRHMVHQFIHPCLGLLLNSELEESLGVTAWDEAFVHCCNRGLMAISVLCFHLIEQ